MAENNCQGKKQIPKGSVKRCTFILILIISFFTNIYAQYPVQVIPQLVGPYTLQLSDYYTGTNPKIFVVLTNNDLQQPMVKVRLRMSIKGQSVTLISKDNVFYPTITLLAGIPQRLSLNDLATYFNPNNLEFQGISKAQYQQNGILPEGFYQFCFEAVEVNTGLVVSKNECALAALAMSDPPFLNLPFNETLVEEQDPTNIIFNWTPRHLSSPNGAFNTVYDFQIVELLDNGIAPEAAFSSAQPLYQFTTKATTLLYGPAQPMLLIGKKYGWRVRVRTTNGIDNSNIFKNNGYSEIHSFTYFENCHAPRNLNAVVDADWNVMIKWAPQTKTIGYDVEYRRDNRSTSLWVSQFTTSTTLLIPNAVPGSKIEYRVLNHCLNGTDIISSQVKSIIVPPYPESSKKALGKIKWVYRLSEENIDSSADALVSKIRKPDLTVNNVFKNNDPGTNEFNLQGAVVKIYGKKSMSLPFLLIGTGKTDTSGNFIIPLDPAIVEPLKHTYAEITHPSGSFYLTTVPIKLTRTVHGYMLGENKVIAQNFELKPSVFIPNYVHGDAVSIDVLLNEATWKRFPFMKPAGLGTGADKIRYNNQQYILLASLTDGKAYKKLFYNTSTSENYVVRVNYVKKKSLFISMSAITSPFKKPVVTDPVLVVKRTFQYKLDMGLEGIISVYDIPRRDVRVELIVNLKDITDGSRETKFTAISDAGGNYGNYKLPALKEGAVIKIFLTDRTLRNKVFTDSVKMDSNLVIKNIYIDNPVYTITGRLLDQDGLPIGNALVTTNNNLELTKTTDKGFYLIKVNGTDPGSIIFNVDGYDRLLKGYSFIRDSSKNIDSTNPAESWQLIIENTNQVKANPALFPGGEVNADLLGIGSGSLVTRYDTYFSQEEKLKGVLDLNTTELRLRKGSLKLTVTFNGKRVRSKLNFSSDVKHFKEYSDATNTEVYYKQLPVGNYILEITPYETDPPFVPWIGEFKIKQNGTTDISIKLTKGVYVTGKIKDQGDQATIDSALVTVTGTIFKGRSDINGNYSIIVPQGQEYEFYVTQKKYNSTDTTFFTTENNTADFLLEKRDFNLPEILTLSGFPVEVDKQVAASGGTMVITGKLLLGENDIFKPDSLHTTLTFKNISVESDNDSPGNAMPLADVEFEEAVLQTKAFGFDVEVSGLPRITMIGLKNEEGIKSWKQCVIGGQELLAKLSNVKGAGYVPFMMPDGVMEFKDPSSMEDLPDFKYVYTAPEDTIDELGPTQEFSISFNDVDTTSTKRKITQTEIDQKIYIRASVAKLFDFAIERESATLSEDGLSLGGYLELPAIPSVNPTVKKIGIESLIINRHLKLTEITFNVSDKLPLLLSIQRIKARVNKLSLLGIGTANYGLGFGGIIQLSKKDASDSINFKDTSLIINELSLVNKPEGPTLSGSFSLSSKGYNIKGLQFTTPGKGALKFSYNHSEKTYVIDAAGKINYVPAGPVKADAAKSALNSLFPIEIQRFTLKTKNWDLFLVAKANIKIDLKVAKLNVETILISVGSTGISLDEMSKYLVSGNNSNKFIGVGGPEQQLDDSKSSWAIGIKGGLEFPIKAINSTIKGAVLVGYINNAIQVRMDSVYIKVQGPAFTAEASLMMSFSGTKQGFAGRGSLTTVKQIFAATFKFYKIEASPGVSAGYEFGASLKVSVGASGITTGPITWFSVGGGFDFNTSAQTYNVFLQGDVGIAGTTKEVGYVKDATVSILFDLKNCNAYPVVEGSGKLVLTMIERGSVSLKVDFCRNLMLATINGDMEVARGATMLVRGTLFAIKGSGNSKGSFFLAVNTHVTTMGNIITGNAFVALGTNYDNNNPNSPQEVRDLWKDIDYNVKDNNGTIFNGVFIKGTVYSPSYSGSFAVNLGPLPAFSFDYNYSGSGTVGLFYQFSTKQFFASATINANASASLNVVGFFLAGNAVAVINLAGGNDGSWYLNGNASINFSLYTNPNAGCNSVSHTWSTCCCVDWPYPVCYWSCPNWWSCHVSCYWAYYQTCGQLLTIDFKLCKSVGASFNYRQGQPVTTSFSFN